MKKRVLVRMEEELHKEIKVTAIRNGMTMEELIGMILRVWMEKRVKVDAT